MPSMPLCCNFAGIRRDKIRRQELLRNALPASRMSRIRRIPFHLLCPRLISRRDAEGPTPVGESINPYADGDVVGTVRTDSGDDSLHEERGFRGGATYTSHRAGVRTELNRTDDEDVEDLIGDAVGHQVGDGRRHMASSSDSNKDTSSTISESHSASKTPSENRSAAESTLADTTVKNAATDQRVAREGTSLPPDHTHERAESDPRYRHPEIYANDLLSSSPDEPPQFGITFRDLPRPNPNALPSQSIAPDKPVGQSKPSQATYTQHPVVTNTPSISFATLSQNPHLKVVREAMRTQPDQRELILETLAQATPDIAELVKTKREALLEFLLGDENVGYTERSA